VTIPKGQAYRSPNQLQAIDDAAGGDPAKVAIMRALVTQENRRFGFANDKAVSPMAQRFNRYLAEGCAKALRAGSLIGVATWCSRPLNIARAALYAAEKPRRSRRRG